MDYPTFMLTLLSGNWLFFEDGEIAWDGSRHSITGLQVNGAQISDFMGFVNDSIDGFEDINEVVNYFVAFMGEIEKDEGLKVPRTAIAPGVRKALPEGDLTGITLANLAACGAAFSVRATGKDEYAVIFDTRLAMGIPCFFSLVARLLWDLRGCTVSQNGKPFAVVFVGARNIDADQYLGSVAKPVDGAQENPGAMSVSSLPEVSPLPSAKPKKQQQRRTASSEKTEPRAKKPKPESSAKPKSESSEKPKPESSAKPKSESNAKPKKAQSSEKPKRAQGNRKGSKRASAPSAEGEQLRMERAEKAALAAHKRVREAFSRGHATVKRAQFNGGAQERILYHLLETGGGLTPEELEEDLRATRGTKWKCQPNDDGRIDIGAILAYMEKPGSEIRRILAESGGFGIVDYSLQSKIDEQSTITRRDGKVFLWCQDGVDYGARLASCKKRQESASKQLEETQNELREAERAKGSLENLPSSIAQLEEKKSALDEELGGLGLFQMKEKRALKARIGELQSDIEGARAKLEEADARVSAARKKAAELEGEIKSLGKAYRSELKHCLALWKSGKLR